MENRFFYLLKQDVTFYMCFFYMGLFLSNAFFFDFFYIENNIENTNMQNIVILATKSAFITILASLAGILTSHFIVDKNN